ncbi:helix-turn-helix domain-containing protein [Azonexus sp. IMCC34839]|uniref:helix-turn-helix domain-containing protein n=1 Tax=Azonexus sp. IMCC34839 TaxID=3133695 RepID=UPI003999A399
MMDREEQGSELPADSTVAIEMPAVGTQLREAREALGLKVSDIAKTLKLGQRQVEALENGQWDGLPGATFIRGFVRNYARLVQLDPSLLVAQLDPILVKPVDTLTVPRVQPADMPQFGGGPARRDRLVVAIGLLAVLLASALYFLLPNDLAALRTDVQSLLDSMARKEEPAAPSSSVAQSEPVLPPGATPQQVLNPQAVTPGETPAPAAPSASPSNVAAAATSAPSLPSGVVDGQMRLVADKEAWVEVRDRENKVVFSQRLAAGAEQIVGGQGPLSVVIGYAPGVRLFWRGQSIDLTPHSRGDVARLVLE